MEDPSLFDPDLWCTYSFPEHRERLAAALLTALADSPGVESVVIEAGTVGREYDLTAATARRLRFAGHGAILTTR